MLLLAGMQAKMLQEMLVGMVPHFPLDYFRLNCFRLNYFRLG